jgi:hypothetical protein
MESLHGSSKNIQQKFPCAEDGCDKRYKNLGGLRYHLLHCHPKRDIDEDIEMARDWKMDLCSE